MDYIINIDREIVEGTLTFQDVLKLITAVLVGETDTVDHGDGTATVTFRDSTDTINRIIAELTGSNRTSLTFDLS